MTAKPVETVLCAHPGCYATGNVGEECPNAVNHQGVAAGHVAQSTPPPADNAHVAPGAEQFDELKGEVPSGNAEHNAADEVPRKAKKKSE